MLAREVASICQGVSHGIIVLSGDTAFSGKDVEYKHGQSLIDSIRTGLVECFPRAPVRVLTIAGNHDCDFSLADSVRGIVIDTLKPERIDDAVVAQCIGVQKSYGQFADYCDPPPTGTVSTPADRIYRQVMIQQGGATLAFHLLNSAWISQLREKAGCLFFPMRMVKERIAAAPPADLVVALLHHPFNWYSPDNARELRQCLEDHADIILTGHEHVSGAYRRQMSTGEQNEYLEGGVLQDSDQPNNSSFNVVLLDIDKKEQQTHHFLWRGDLYSSEGEPYWRPFERNKRLTRTQFQFSDEFGEWLEGPRSRIHSSSQGPSSPVRICSYTPTYRKLTTTVKAKTVP